MAGAVTVEEPWQRAKRIIEARTAEAEKKQRRKIKVTDEAKEPNPWLRRVRWAHHLAEMDLEEMRELIRLVDEEKEVVLSAICNSFDRVIQKAKQNAIVEVVGESALFRVNGIEYGKKAEQPFPAEMENNTDVKYRTVWRKLLCYIFRVEQRKPEERPKYRLTTAQKRAFRVLMTKAKASPPIDPDEEMSDAC
jgi:hypothetical protein